MQDVLIPLLFGNGDVELCVNKGCISVSGEYPGDYQVMVRADPNAPDIYLFRRTQIPAPSNPDLFSDINPNATYYKLQMITDRKELQNVARTIMETINKRIIEENQRNQEKTRKEQT